MGKMLDLLMRGLQPNGGPGDEEASNIEQGSPLAVDQRKPTASLDAPEIEDSSIPFIEVGAGMGVEASPTVLETPPRHPTSRSRKSRTTPSPRPVPAVETAEVMPTRELASCQQFAPELVVYHSPNHPASVGYRQLLPSLFLGNQKTYRSILSFVPAAAEKECATLVLNLALTVAQRGWPVVVIDASGQPDTVAGPLGLSCTPGLAEVFTGLVSLQEAIRPTIQDNLRVITAGQLGSTQGIRFVAETARSVTRQLATQEPQNVLLIVGPRDPQPTTFAWGPLSDAVFVVVPEGMAESPAVEELSRQLRQQNCPLAGCILAG